MNMPEFDTRLRQVGDSMGLLVPHEVIEELGARAGEVVHVVIPARIDWSKIWGQFKTKATTDELIRKARTARD